MTSAKIFLNEQRGRLETAAFRRLSTFAFGDYAHPNRQAFGQLRALNEETLAGGQAVTLPVPEATQVLVLPITGAVRAGVPEGVPALVEVEEIYVVAVAAGGTVRFSNPFEDEFICFLHIWLAAPDALAGNQLLAFDWGVANCLQAATIVASAGGAALPGRVQLGRFAGRAEARHKVPDPAAGCFVFVLAGAFEVANRLLHTHDGLALLGFRTIELEALSNDAVVLLLNLYS